MFNKRLFRFSFLALTAFLLLIGGVVVAQGPIAGPHTVIIHQFDGEQVGDGFGWIGADLGDITGDGINELLITAPFFADGDGALLGKFYVYSGSDGALLNSQAGAGFDLLGYSAATAGDVDADGVADYIVGALVGGYANVYSGADHSLLMQLTGAGGGDFFGATVVGMGDITGDGYGDIVVGARNASDAFNQAGKAYLISGVDGSVIWTTDGQSAFARLGSGGGLVGDVNNDGVPDVVLGAMFSGAFGGGEAFVLSGADGSVIHTLAPERPEDASVFGQFFASGAGDYNADGVPDIYVADYNATVDGVAGTGNAFVFSGVDGSILEALDGREPGGGFGPGRAFADIDGDGFGDLVIGSYTSNKEVATGGKVEVFTGRGSLPVRRVQKIVGNVAGDSLGVDALPIGDMNADGLIDFVATAFGHVYVVAGDPNLPNNNH